MGSSHQSSPAPSADFVAVFLAAADSARTLRFDAFMRLALYHPQVGYYRQARRRVGRETGTDFYTATSSGPLFGELISAASVALLGSARPADFTFVEIGAEPGGGVLRGAAHPFAAAHTLSVGEPLRLAGPCVVFSNELFDAQPFRRFRRTETGWLEGHVELDRDGRLTEVFQSGLPPFDAPEDVLPGYTVDWPEASIELARSIAQEPWHGLFLAFDYGKSWAELSTVTPAGTARAYLEHTQSNEILARPGHQDLTCHVCWDALAGALVHHGFMVDPILSQEAFLVKNAGDYLAATLEREGGGFSSLKQSILQLLHPSNLGQKFQVLAARRGARENSP